MTFLKGIYSFKCTSEKLCIWTKEPQELQISRRYHIALTVPSALMKNCPLQENNLGLKNNESQKDPSLSSKNSNLIVSSEASKIKYSVYWLVPTLLTVLSALMKNC